MTFKKGQVPWNKGKTGVYSEEMLVAMGKPKRGKRLTEEHKRRISEGLRGKPNGWRGKHHTEATRGKLSQALKGRPKTEEHKRKISEALQGREFSDEHRRNIGKAGKGRCPSFEARRKMSEAGRGRPKSEEHKRKIGDANKGHKHTEELKHKMSEARKIAWAMGVYETVNFNSRGLMYSDVRMRSSWEARLAQAFDELGWAWEYESKKFQYSLDDGEHTYIPDFYVPQFSCYFDPHWARRDDSDKFKAVREQCDIALIVLSKSLLEMYERMAGQLT